MTVTKYDIQELVTQSGVPRRTIYFYVQQGILPPPEGAGLAAYYTEDHLLRLRLIPLLRQQGLRLDEIRARFVQMGAEEMRGLLNASHPAPAPAAPRSTHEPARPEIPTVAREWGEQRYLHYALPGGMALVAPENLSLAERQRLNQLLQAARQIFSGSPFVYMETGRDPGSPTSAAGSAPREEE